MMADDADRDRVFTPRGKCAHIVPAGEANSSRRCIRCGRGPTWGNVWLGTGNMSEYERAAGLPLCEATKG